MANTANKSNRTKKSGSARSSSKKSRKKKNSSDDTMKFLLVLVIAGIAIALIIFSQKNEPGGSSSDTTPTPSAAADISTVPEKTPIPSGEQTQMPQPTTQPEVSGNTPMPTEQAETTVKPTETPVSTPTPTPVLSTQEAKALVTEKVDTSVYDVQLVNENLFVGNGSYYQFGAIKNQEFVSPFLVVSKTDGSLHFYDSTEDTVFDFTKFPLQAEATATPSPTPEPSKNLTAKEAYEVLCSYSKDSLHIAKEVKEYDAEYDEDLTLINGVDCYRINLSEFSNGKVRNRGEFYVSVDGKTCYYIDSDTNEFVKAIK